MNPAQILAKQDSGIEADQSVDDDEMLGLSLNGKAQVANYEYDVFNDFRFVNCVPDVLRVLPANDPSFVVSPVESVASEISLPFSEVTVDPSLVEVRRRSGSMTTLFSSQFRQALAECRTGEKSIEDLVNEPLTRNKSKPRHVGLPLPDYIYEKMDAIMNESIGGSSSEGSKLNAGKDEDPKKAPMGIDDPVERKEKVVEYFDSRARQWRVRGNVHDVVVLQCDGPSGPLEEILSTIETEPVPYETLEISRVKCDEWLDKHYDEEKKILGLKK